MFHIVSIHCREEGYNVYVHCREAPATQDSSHIYRMGWTSQYTNYSGSVPLVLATLDSPPILYEEAGWTSQYNCNEQHEQIIRGVLPRRLQGKTQTNCSSSYCIRTARTLHYCERRDILYMYTAGMRGVLENTSPRTKRLPEAQERHLEGQGKSWGRMGCTTQYIRTRGSVRTAILSSLIHP